MMVPWWFDWLWWWRWSLFDVVEPRWWRWSVFDDDMLMEMMSCLDDMMYIDGDDLALITWWRWHALTWWVLDPLMMVMVDPCWSPCTWWWPWGHVRDDIPSCWWYIHVFDVMLMSLWALMSFGHGDDMMAWHTWVCDEVSYTISFTYPCASPTYSCNPLQDPHTPILNPNIPSYTLPCILHYPFTLPIT